MSAWRVHSHSKFYVQNYHQKSVVTQIHNDAGVELTSHTVVKCLPHLESDQRLNKAAYPKLRDYISLSYQY